MRSTVKSTVTKAHPRTHRGAVLKKKKKNRALCCFSTEPRSLQTTIFSTVCWRVSDPVVITHDRLSETGPGQAESRDQPLLCLCLPIRSMNITIQTDSKYRELLPSSLATSQNTFLFQMTPSVY